MDAGMATSPRRLDPQWDAGLIAASIAVSLLGAFTSTQLMCQARMSLRFSSVVVWTALGSLTFGFCSIWCLHFVAMLACKLDLQIGINAPLTIASAFLAVFFTFLALASDLLCDRYRQNKRRRRHRPKTAGSYKDGHTEQDSSEPLLPMSRGSEDAVYAELSPDESETPDQHDRLTEDLDSHSPSLSTARTKVPDYSRNDGYEPNGRRDSSVGSMTSRRSSTLTGTSQSSTGLRDILHMAFQTTAPAKNAFVATGERLYSGCTIKNISKGFLWSLAITSMHYVGILALRVPQGYVVFHPGLVILSALISWVVCLVGCILMSKIETHLAQQLLFAAVASTGVAAMHFTGGSCPPTFVCMAKLLSQVWLP